MVAEGLISRLLCDWNYHVSCCRSRLRGIQKLELDPGWSPGILTKTRLDGMDVLGRNPTYAGTVAYLAGMLHDVGSLGRPRRLPRTFSSISQPPVPIINLLLGVVNKVKPSCSSCNPRSISKPHVEIRDKSGSPLQLRTRILARDEPRRVSRVAKPTIERQNRTESKMALLTRINSYASSLNTCSSSCSTTCITSSCSTACNRLLYRLLEPT